MYNLTFEATLSNDSLDLSQLQNISAEYELVLGKVITAPLPQIQYSTNGTSWHSSAQFGDRYFRFSVDGGNTWGNPMENLGSEWGEIVGSISNQTDLQNALNAKASVSSLNSHTGNSEIHVTAINKSAWNAKYDKPSSGIPKTDLSDGVQTSLDKADTAIQEHQSLADYPTRSQMNAAIDSHHDSTKVDKELGKGLSENNYTTGDKNKLSGIESGAEVNVIETVKVDDVTQEVTNKEINILLPNNARRRQAWKDIWGDKDLSTSGIAMTTYANHVRNEELNQRYNNYAPFKGVMVLVQAPLNTNDVLMLTWTYAGVNYGMRVNGTIVYDGIRDHFHPDFHNRDFSSDFNI